ncbi:MAG: SDR family oxidoreductase [Candidatus Babeliales bacterium]
MFIKFFKWFAYVFTGASALLLSTLVIFSLFNKSVPINQSTKTCLITGASSGIGREVAREMINRGWKVIGIARREEILKEVAHEFGEAFIPYVCDVSIPEQVATVSEAIKKQGLQPTLFFLNAGTGYADGKFQPLLNNHRQIFDTNYFGVIAWVDAWLNGVTTYGGGTFVATSSVNALFAGPGAGGYGASKSALNACFKALRLQYLNDNIGFILVLPGPVATEMLKAPRPMPFTHQATDEARYIVDQVFKGAQHIEPSWFYSCLLRKLNWLPDTLVLKIVS